MSVRERLILSTVGLMQRRGVAATGVADILDDSDVSRRSIYLNFAGGKPELVAEATRWSGQWIAEQIEHYCAGDPRDALAQFVFHWKTLLSGSDFEAGCPVAAAATARTVAPEAATAAGAAFTRWHEILTGTMSDHGISDSRAHALSTTIVAAVEGAVIMSLAQRTLAPLDDVEAELAILIDHARSR